MFLVMDAAELYRRVREKEGRIYPDEIVARLPEVPPGHPLQQEWQGRAASIHRMFAYLRGSGRRLTILELGCGNGWLSHRLSAVPGVHVWGLDRFGPELRQAARIFRTQNLAFSAADIFSPPFPPGSFDMIVLASVIQYFPDLAALIRALCMLLAKGGELHLLDSPLYRKSEIGPARERTRAYYAALGIPEMADHYFHHAIESVEAFRPRWLYRPSPWHSGLGRALGRPDSPFPWLVIQRS